FRGDTHLTFLCRVSRPTPCFSYSTHVFNFNIALRCMCLREDLDQKSSPRSNWAVWEYTRKSCGRVVPRPLGDVPVGAYDSTRLFAFDLLELDGRDLRREPLEVRKATLASVLRKARSGVQLN